MGLKFRAGVHRLWLCAGAVLLALLSPGAQAQSQPAINLADYPTYDYVALGAPKFVSTNYLDPSIVTKISKFRSGYGHSYVDFVETCRSMKHYLFTTSVSATGLHTPVAGKVVAVMDDSGRGTQVWIQADAQPSFIFILFHLDSGHLPAVGDHLSEGQLLGGLYPTQTDPAAGGANSDIAVAVRVPGPELYRQISYFEVLTDAGFAPFKARGLNAPTDVIITQAQRDAQPLACNGETFLAQPTAADFVTLSGGAAPLTVAATTLGRVNSSTQTAAQSFIRLYNANQAQATVTLTLYDSASGVQLGQWTSPTLGPGAAPQFSMATIEAGLPPGIAKPAAYNITAQSTGATYAQHVLWRPADGTLTNLSVCDGYVTALSSAVIGAHSSLIAGYPSTIAVVNAGTVAAAVPLGVYDASNGGRMGSFTTPAIPPGGQYVTTMTALEQAAKVTVINTPGYKLYHYVVRSEARSSGIFLQNLVSNSVSGVVTDMTTLCQVSQIPASASQTFDKGHGVRPGPIFSSAQAGSQSFLRFSNIDTSSARYTVNLRDYASGVLLGSWTTPSIPVGAAQQFAIAGIEAAVGLTANQPLFYAVDLQSTNAGLFQHVLWRASDGSLTDLSTCEVGIMSQASQLDYVHASLLDADYPSQVVITNTGTDAITPTLQVSDSDTAAVLGLFTTASVPPQGELVLSAQDIEAQVPAAAGPGRYHYSIKALGGLTGFLQHIVNNKRSGVLTDMTTVCNMPKLR